MALAPTNAETTRNPAPNNPATAGNLEAKKLYGEMVEAETIMDALEKIKKV
jgi:hypothetical protein